jgi:predicted amidohydrolase YtcJ
VEPNAVVELEGKTVTPGLIDPHNHMQVVGLMESSYVAFMPPEVKTLADLTKKLDDALATQPKGEWLQGYFLSVGEGRLPNRHDLDPASPDHPVWMVQQGGHRPANSAALNVRITASTPNPASGLIERTPRVSRPASFQSPGDGPARRVFPDHRRDGVEQHCAGQLMLPWCYQPPGQQRAGVDNIASIQKLANRAR